jgi:hypothetical protein
MYLKNFNQMTKCCAFDKMKGCGGDFQYLEDRKTSGFCSQGEYGWVAVYPENQSLVVQINEKKWDLLEDGSEVDYFHIYDKKLTSFKISNARNLFDLVYQSWWAERDDFEPDPISASREEENVEEDIFGYIHMLNENKSSARNLFDLWTKNLSEDKG